jgi:hypothetical protein
MEGDNEVDRNLYAVGIIIAIADNRQALSDHFASVSVGFSSDPEEQEASPFWM